jgi:branched-chain amino acid transport system substrate-binding protein
MGDRPNRTKHCSFTTIIIGIIFIIISLISMPADTISQPKSPIKIGILYPFVGPETYLGKRQLRGWELALEQVDYKVADRPIKLIVEDDKSDPSVGVTKVTKLIEQDRVHLLGGVINSAVAYAVRDTVERSEIPLVITMANAGGLTREKRSPYIFRTFAPGGAASHFMADFIYKELKLRKAVFSAADYAYGHEHAEMFKRRFETLGGQVLLENFAPLATADYGPYVAELNRYAGKADVLHFVYSGADALRFVKAVGDFGLNKKFVLTNWGATPDGSSYLPQMGSAAEGVYHINVYFFELKNPANQRFLELNKRRGGGLDAVDFNGYLAANVVLHALQELKGNVEAKDEFLKALRGVKFEAPNGPFQFDPRSQNVLVNFVIGRVRKADGEFGKYQNTVVKTIPQAQDPWWIGR